METDQTERNMDMNEKLALSDDILLSVDKPERYIGCEINSVVKN